MHEHRLSTLDHRIPAWNLSRLQDRTCPVCMRPGHEKYQRPDRLKVRHCDGCGLWFISPSPTPEQLDTFYSTYSISHQRNEDTPDETAAAILQSDGADSIVIQELSALDAIRGKRCLDVGSGPGRYLHWLRKGGAASVTGIELDPAAVQFCRSRLGLSDVRQGTIFDLPPGEQVDTILMMDFIEHPLEILPTLRKAAEILKPGGVLAALTPHGHPVGDDPVVFRVDLEHMQYFNARSCWFVAKSLGLEIVHLETYGYPDLSGLGQASAGGAKRALKAATKRLKAVVRKMPGFSAARSLRSCLSPSKDRLGSYHLLCIWQKPAT